MARIPARRPSRPGRRLLRLAITVVAIAVTLVAGLVVGLRPAETPAPPSFTVAIGKVGDLVTLHGTWTETGTLDGAPLHTSGTFDRALRLDGLGVSIDAFGQAHDALRVMERTEGPSWTAGVLGGSDDTLHGYAVDPGSRETVRSDRLGAFSSTVVTLATQHSRFPVTEPERSGLPELAWQGRRLTLGGTLPSREWDLLSCPGERVGVGFNLTFAQTWVGSAAKIGAESALAVHSQRTYWFVRPDGQREDVNETTVAWHTASSPYPVRTDRFAVHAAPGMRTTVNETSYLARLDPGVEPVPWRDEATWSCPVGENQGAQRAGDGQIRDGSAFGLAFPLELAVASALQDMSLPEFQRFLATHPQPDVIGASYRHYSDPPADSSSDPYWTIHFGSGTDGFTLLSTRISGTPLIVNREHGPDNIFRAHWMGPFVISAADRALWETRPTSPLTLSQIEDYWDLLAGGPGERFIGEITWGYGAFRASYNELEFYQVDGVRDVKTYSTFTSSTSLRVNMTTGRILLYDDFAPFTQLDVQQALGGGAPDLQATSPARAPPNLQIALLTGSVIGLLLAAYFLTGLKALAKVGGVAAGYAKIHGEELLQHDTRGRLARLVGQDPGIAPPELQRATGLPGSTLAYHLRTLERDGLIVSRIDGRHKRLFPPGTAPVSQRQVSALRNPTTARILELVQASPGINQSEAARSMGITPPAVRKHVVRLVREGLVVTERSGRQMRLRAVA